VVDDLLDVCAAEVSDGTRAHLQALVEKIDADIVASIAAGPELWALARELRAEADARIAKLKRERAAIAAARAASPARVLAALRWRRAGWLDEFRQPEGEAHRG
jgi:hypothetical protein